MKSVSGRTVPGFGARTNVAVNSAEYLEFFDRMLRVRAHATNSA